MRLKEEKENILQTIGNTPIIFLEKVSRDLKTRVYAKVEAFNPGHSAKDRIAQYAIDKAEREGRLKKGGTIIESTSGNTGRSLAMIAALRGYKCVFFSTTKISFEKQTILKALGAEVHICPASAKSDDPDSYYSRAKALHAITPNSIYVNQYYNDCNIEGHYYSTGPEIWRQTEGKITHYVACVGSGGTISGTAKYLKEQNEGVKVFGVDAFGSVLTKFHREGVLDLDEVKPYKLDGVGKKIIPGTVLFDKIDKFFQVEDSNGLNRARELAKTESILTGPSGGAAIEGLYQMKDEFAPDDCVVVILSDHGAGYLSTLYNDEWMITNGFLEPEVQKKEEVLVEKINGHTQNHL